MIEKSIAIYVFIDDLLKEIKHNEPTNRNMSDAEIITTVLVSAIYFYGHHEKAMSFMSSTGMVKTCAEQKQVQSTITPYPRVNCRSVLPVILFDDKGIEYQFRVYHW